MWANEEVYTNFSNTVLKSLRISISVVLTPDAPLSYLSMNEWRPDYIRAKTRTQACVYCPSIIGHDDKLCVFFLIALARMEAKIFENVPFAPVFIHMSTDVFCVLVPRPDSYFCDADDD